MNSSTETSSRWSTFNATGLFLFGEQLSRQLGSAVTQPVKCCTRRIEPERSPEALPKAVAFNGKSCPNALSVPQSNGKISMTSNGLSKGEPKAAHNMYLWLRFLGKDNF